MERDNMEQQIDEMNKIIYVKCTEEEKRKIILESSPYLYDYEFSFIIEEKSTNQ
jgi:hypothetical protein